MSNPQHPQPARTATEAADVLGSIRRMLGDDRPGATDDPAAGRAAGLGAPPCATRRIMRATQDAPPTRVPDSVHTPVPATVTAAAPVADDAALQAIIIAARQRFAAGQDRPLRLGSDQRRVAEPDRIPAAVPGPGGAPMATAAVTGHDPARLRELLTLQAWITGDEPAAAPIPVRPDPAAAGDGRPDAASASASGAGDPLLADPANPPPEGFEGLMRLLVRDLIQREFQGELGRQVSRNLQGLVRDEVRRALGQTPEGRARRLEPDHAGSTLTWHEHAGTGDQLA